MKIKDLLHINSYINGLQIIGVDQGHVILLRNDNQVCIKPIYVVWRMLTGDYTEFRETDSNEE